MNNSPNVAQLKKKKMGIGKRNKLIFYIAVMALPCLQFIIFWIAVNINSILLAFRDYHPDTNTFTFYGIQNFVDVIKDLGRIAFMKAAFKNSFMVYFIGLFVSVPLGIIFSFYLYKKKIHSKERIFKCCNNDQKPHKVWLLNLFV
jgi:ABC-type sugar transport system permease subunit